MTDAAFDRPQTFWERFLFPVRRVNARRLEERVRNKTILITGASYGIGEKLAQRLSACPVTLILIARTKEKLEALQAQFAATHCTTQIYAADLRDEHRVEAILADIRQKNIEPDILVSNAGHSIYRPLLQSLDRYHDTKRSAAINYLSPVQLLLGLLPSLVKKKGNFINVSTVTQYLPHTAGWSAYYSSKAAFDDWLRCAEPELKAAGVSLHQVYLPLVRTRMSMVTEKNWKRSSLSPDKAVDAILGCLLRNKRKYRPWCIAPLRLLHVLLPSAWYRMQLRHLKNKGR